MGMENIKSMCETSIKVMDLNRPLKTTMHNIKVMIALGNTFQAMNIVITG